ncbi:MAG: putative Histidine kinase [Promethearchaeota archaeon]|nr:MAG: putative Histidine kinase [Candidatus Lokiarchaeota archaeon]
MQNNGKKRKLEILERRLGNLDDFSKEILTLTFNSVSIGLFLLDKKRNILFSNKKGLELFNFSLGLIVGKSISEFLNLVNASTYNSDFERCINYVFQTGKTKKIEFEICMNDRKLKWLDVSFSPFKINESHFLSLNFKDITHGKEFELKLHESEEKFHIIAEQLFMAIVIFQDFQIKYHNKKLTDLTGYTKDEINSWKPGEFINLIHPDDRKGAMSKIKNRYIGKINTLINYQFRLVSKKGEIKWVEVFSKAIPYKNGEADLTTIIDLSDKKKIEQDLLFTQFSLDHSAEAAFWAVSNADLIYVNEAACHSLGYSREELLNMKVYDIDPNMQENVWKDHWNRLKKRGTFTIESHHLCKNGKTFPVEITVNYLRYESNEFNCVIARDISERKVAEERLKKSEQKYREAYKRASLYKDIFTHDMGNLLQNIQSSSELASLYQNNEDELSTFMELNEIIRDQVKRGSKLLSNVRKLTEIENSEENLTSTYIIPILEETIEYVKKSVVDKILNIHLDIPDPELRACRIYANELLMDVFENILFNSTKHNENFQVDIIIKISKHKTNDTNDITIRFIDNAMGIADSIKKQIFQRAANQSVKGMGLGLTLVKKIVDSYEGNIWVEDRVKGDHTKGSIFHLCLPLIS